MHSPWWGMSTNFKREITNRGEIRNIFSGSCVKFLKPIRFTDDSSCGSDLHDVGYDDDNDDDGSTQRKEVNRNRQKRKFTMTKEYNHRSWMSSIRGCSHDTQSCKTAQASRTAEGPPSLLFNGYQELFPRG